MATKEDAAKWMADELNRNGSLSQARAVRYIKNEIGKDFTHKNKNGNLAINKDVLEEFKKLTGEDAVWVRGDFRWRRRKATDKPGREQK